MIEEKEKYRIEAFIFESIKPVSSFKIARNLKIPKRKVLAYLKDLEKEFNFRGIKLVKINNKFIFQANPEFALEKKEGKKRLNLNPAALEITSLLVYKGPLTKKEIDKIRGVDSYHALNTLCNKNLVRKKVDYTKKTSIYEISDSFYKILGFKNKESLQEEFHSLFNKNLA